MEKHVADTTGEVGIVMVAIIFVAGIAIGVFILMYNKRSVMKFNFAYGRIIQTKNFAQLLNVISSHKVRQQKNKLSDIIFTHFQKVVRDEFEELKSREDYVEIVKLFYNINTSYRWNNDFQIPLYKEFCSYIQIYTEKLLDETQGKEKLFSNVSELDKISLELGDFFESAKNYSPKGISIKALHSKFKYLRTELLENSVPCT